MARYRNGQIPSHLLVEVGPYHWLTAATAARWRALVADIKAREGVTLRITPGKNGYRDLNGQKFARTNACRAGRCNDAAVPGTSSHGGEYQGRDSMAIDVANWAVLGKNKWYSYCRKHGFEPGFFDWEPWHIIDWNPWAMPSGSGANYEEDDVSAEEVWKYPVRRGGGDVIAIQELADAKTNTIQIRDALAPVNRGGKEVSIRQEIADAKSNSIQILAEMKALAAAVQSLAIAKGADPEAILSAVEDGVKEAMRGITFTADIDG